MSKNISFFPFILVAFLTQMPSSAQSFTIATVAGSSRLGDGGQATTVPLRYPFGNAQDAAGNVYFADASDNRIRKVDVNGVITTVAGNGVAGFGGDNGPAKMAMLNFPQGVKIDSKGANLYVADYYNHRVRMINLATGVITTIAGNGNPNWNGDTGQATQLGMDVYDVAVDTAGNVYIADSLNSRIRKVLASNGSVSTIAGLSTPGNAGDNGKAALAAINGPQGISVDAQNNVYFVDYNNNRVRMINQASGIISNFAGTGDYGYGEPGYDGNGGKAVDALLALPFSTAVEANGNVLVLCAFELWRVFSTNGTIQFVAGSDNLSFAGDGGPAMGASFAVMYYVNTAANGDILIADLGNYRQRRIHGGNVNTVAGTTVIDGIAADNAFLNQPDGLAIDSKNNIVITDTGDSRIRSVSAASGLISNVTGTGIRGSDPGELFFPRGGTYDSAGNLYFADYENNRVMKLPPGSAILQVAGNGTRGFGGDGNQANQAYLNYPTGVVVDTAGNMYIADNGNERIRMVDLNGDISTIAGNGKANFLGDGSLAAKAQLDPYDVALDNQGNLYVADMLNSRIRKINLKTNIITTVAGIGTPGYTGDRGPATSAQLNFPTSVAVDSAGNLYISDAGNFVVRRVDAVSGIIDTIAGNGQIAFNGETGTALSVAIDPMRVAFDSGGNIYIDDSFNDRIRKLMVQVPSTMTIFAGDQQSGAPGTVASIAVKVTDATGLPVGNVLVNFTVSSGVATLSSPSAATAGDGAASVKVTFGATPGALQIAAAATGLTGVTFHLTISQPATPQPTITSGQVEGAGLSVPAVQALSTGGIASVFGTNFGGPATYQAVGTNDLVNGQAPTTFQDVCVTVGGINAPIFGVSATQINFQTPSVPSGGSLPVQVISGCGTSNSLTSNSISVPIQDSTPEFFYFAHTANGVNPVAATDAISGALLAAANLFPGSGIAPAKPNEYVVIYGTGFGATNPAVAPGVFPASLAQVVAPVTVTLGGVQLPAANVLYAGVTPGSPGLYQLNLLVPASTPSGNLPVVIQIGDQQSPAGAYLTVQGN